MKPPCFFTASVGAFYCLSQFNFFFSQKVRRWVHWTVAEALWTTLERGKPTLFSQRCPFLYFSALLPFLPREGPFQEDLCFPSPPRANRVLQMLSWFTNLRLGLIPIADSCAYLKLARGNSWVLSCSNNAGPYFGKGASFLGNLTLPDYNMLLPNRMIIGSIADHILPTHNLLKNKCDISAISVARVILEDAQ